MSRISTLGLVVACGISVLPTRAQTTQAPQEPLVDSLITTMKGAIRPGRTVLINGAAVNFPDGCAFH